MIVVDTNVISELMKRERPPAVVAWVAQQSARELFTTATSVAEILYGIERLPAGKRRDGLEAAASEVFAGFADQVLPFDEAAAVHYAAIVSSRERAGRPIDGFDAQIAATCRVNRASLATRNTKDFEEIGIDLIDPWAKIDQPGAD